MSDYTSRKLNTNKENWCITGGISDFELYATHSYKGKCILSLSSSCADYNNCGLITEEMPVLIHALRDMADKIEEWVEAEKGTPGQQYCWAVREAPCSADCLETTCPHYPNQENK